MVQRVEDQVNGLGIKEFYSGKTILITGTTGFLGKVVLEKIIRVIPDFKKIFVMIRAKKNMALKERFKRQVLDSEIFIPAFRQDPSLRQKIRDRVVPVAGDLIVD